MKLGSPEPEGLLSQPDVVGDLAGELISYREDLELLRQNSLLESRDFIKFSINRGVEAQGILQPDITNFSLNGWISADGIADDKSLLFHPFRFFQLYLILQACKLQTNLHTPAFSGKTDYINDFFYESLKNLPTKEEFNEHVRTYRRVINLSILLEPILWPEITGIWRNNSRLSVPGHKSRHALYKESVWSLISNLNPSEWKTIHQNLRLRAYILDQNEEVYLLMRFSKWEKREELKGNLSSALWLRHIAEMIRRAFEEVHEVRWQEEDVSVGWQPPLARELAYGAERPTDDPKGSSRALSLYFGLSTGTPIRWYLEGETEYFAVKKILGEPGDWGIELMNLAGNISSGKNNVHLKLENFLKADIEQKRFSVISIDGDVLQNLNFIKGQVKKGNIVGNVSVSRPDFEFGNFSCSELLQIVSKLNSCQGFRFESLRLALANELRTASMNYDESEVRNIKGLLLAV